MTYNDAIEAQRTRDVKEVITAGANKEVTRVKNLPLVHIEGGV